MKLSIVTTLYKSSPYVEEFHQRASAVVQQHVGEEYEIVFVNFGSSDRNSYTVIFITCGSRIVLRERLSVE